ncbi:SDR family NAD(P)-dependent oxidoreductase, partial [Streptomyces sp. NPDC087917]|uniref:SDR family NAD(P)-dependent oxidoreductase n=1 Tax=Streptomyces sp. NPDC087917 TaxID=3155060 RepID=UPI0034208526
VGATLELGPDAVLSALVAGAVGEEIPAALPALRRGHSEPAALVTALGRLHEHGVHVDWSAYFAGSGARRVPLPTYAFQHERYWVDRLPRTGLPGHDGTPGHPLLGTPLTLAGSDETVFTSRISLRTHPWLADHLLHGTPVLPAAAVVEMALRAGEALGRPALDELDLLAPLPLPEDGGVLIQLRAGSPDPDDPAGRRGFALYARTDDADDTDPAFAGAFAGDTGWTLHAQGHYLDETATAGPAADWSADSGLPLTVLPEEQAAEAPGYGIHPALLTAALPARAATAAPVHWYGVRLHVPGAVAVRARATEIDDLTYALQLADAEGRLVASVDSVVFRTLDRALLPTAPVGAAGRNVLYGLEWEPVTLPLAERTPTRHVLDLGHPDALAVAATAVEADPTLTLVLPLPAPTGPAAADVPGAVRTATRAVLGLLRQWAADERLEGTRLLVLTSGAVAVSPGEDIGDPAGAAVWGLLRSAQSETPGRILLVDTDTRLVTETDTGTDVAAAAEGIPDDTLARLLAGGEPQVALRAGAVLVPRLRPLPAPASASVLGAEGTVLITGGTGALGATVARHLVAERGARHVLLLSRQGDTAGGAKQLLADLEELGARAEAVACDVTNRAALAAVVAAIPAAHPLTAVVHAAGVLDNALVPELTPDRLASVLAPKADGAWHLHELTRDLDLEAFVLFSSSVGVLGGPGQANYAAANAFLDALAVHRHAHDLPATSIAWGVWQPSAGTTGGGTGINAHLTGPDLDRLAHEGYRPLTGAEGLALYDRAVAGAGPAVVAVPLGLSALRARPRVPAVLTALPGLRGRAAVAPTAAAASDGPAATTLAGQLGALTPAERERLLLTLVSTESAAALGRTGPASIDAERPFQELGFDSLTALDLRNRLVEAAGVTLPATLVFDHPTPAALAAHLGARLVPEAPDPGEALLAELVRLDPLLNGLSGDDPDHPAVTARLRALLSRLEAAGAQGDPDGGPDSGADAGADVLAASSIDDIFSIIDTELGRSAD